MVVKTVEKHGFIWRWDGGSLVEVDDKFNDVYCYTVDNGSEEAFLDSIDDMLEVVVAASIKLYN